jgi:hypothetical protein
LLATLMNMEQEDLHRVDIVKAEKEMEKENATETPVNQ